MIEIAIVVLMGRYYYKLAEKFDKNKWLYTILGIVTFYGTILLTGFVYAVYFFSQNPYASEEDLNTLMITFIGIVIGGFTSYLLYFLLERNWKKNDQREPTNIDDIGKRR